MNTFTTANLIAMGRHIPTPFYLDVVEDAGIESLRLESILRIVPGKRLIAVSTWKKQTVIVKLFFHAGSWKRNQLRDIRGVNLLTQANIPTPSILHQTTTPDRKGGVLMIEYLQEGTSLMSLFESAQSLEEKHRIQEMAITTIANCHDAGIWQEDIHLENFILLGELVYVIDGGAVRAARRGMDDETSLGNLALFLAQFPVAMDENAEFLFQRYMQEAPSLANHNESDLMPKILTARMGRLASFGRKLFRSTTSNRCVRSSGQFLVYDRQLHSADLDKFIEDPDSYIEAGKIIKNGNTSTVSEVTIGDQTYILKRYNIKNFWHGVRRFFRASRAHHCWRNASLLEMLGIATPHPLLFMEERVLWVFRMKAYLLCEKIQSPHLEAQIAADRYNKIDQTDLLDAFRRLLQIMRDYKISHGDMKATNFIYENNELFVLDLDAMRRHSSTKKFDAKYSKDLARFRRNWIGTRLEAGVNDLIEEVQGLTPNQGQL